MRAGDYPKMNTFLPWHQPQWDQIAQRIAQSKMPHALLIAGPADSGKSLFLDALAGRLLCRKGTVACGECDQCHLLQAGTHPDMLEVTLEDSKQIKIDQIRELTEWANQTAQQGGYKVCVIHPADKLNRQSANALLKSLEEPPARTLLCLSTDQPNQLLPTLRSRCQRIDLTLPSAGEAKQWLNGQVSDDADVDMLLLVAGGLPLRVLSTVDDDYLALRKNVSSGLVAVLTGQASPLGLAASLAKSPPDRVLELMYLWLSDVIRMSLAGKTTVSNTDLLADFEACESKVSLEKRFELLARVNRARAAMSSTSNANHQMMLEWLLTD